MVLLEQLLLGIPALLLLQFAQVLDLSLDEAEPLGVLLQDLVLDHVVFDPFGRSGLLVREAHLQLVFKEPVADHFVDPSGPDALGAGLVVGRVKQLFYLAVAGDPDEIHLLVRDINAVRELVEAASAEHLAGLGVVVALRVLLAVTQGGLLCPVYQRGVECVIRHPEDHFFCALDMLHRVGEVRRLDAQGAEHGAVYIRDLAQVAAAQRSSRNPYLPDTPGDRSFFPCCAQ